MIIIILYILFFFTLLLPHEGVKNCCLNCPNCHSWAPPPPY